MISRNSYIRRMLCAFIAFFITSTMYAQVPSAEGGVLNASSWDFDKNNLPLVGVWHFHDMLLLSPEECKSIPVNFQQFPAIWNDLRPDQTGTGYATYYLQLIISTKFQNLALSIPQLYSSYTIWINGKKIGNNGIPAVSKETYKPQWRPQVLPFMHPGDTIHLVMHIANFDHHLGGSREPIYVGNAEMLTSHHTNAIISTLIESITMLVIAIISILIFYMQGEKKKVITYFALLCISWSIRAAFSNLYFFIHFFPEFNWTMMIKIEYVTLYFTMIWGLLFLSRLFPNEENKIIKYLLVTANSFFVAFTLLTNPQSFTRWLPIYLILCCVLLLYALILVIRALVNERTGAWYLIFSIVLALIIFGLDVSAYQGVITYKPILFSIGYIIIFLLLATTLLFHLNIFKSSSQSSTLTFEELYSQHTKGK
jgi:hypothetical protein